MTWENLLELARAEVAETIAALPEKFRGHASALPVVYERVPNAALIQDAIEPDTLGLFVGTAFADEAGTQAGVPPQIILLLENICEMVEGDPDEFRTEVRRTFLHELGITSDSTKTSWMREDCCDPRRRGLGQKITEQTES